jgi:hypothetical protein
MGKLTRRDVSLVEARRVPPPAEAPPSAPPQTVFIPTPIPTTPAASPDARPHVTQNFFNVTVPAAGGVGSPAAPTLPPTEIHHHHNTVNYTARPLAPTRGLSFFGVAGLVLGTLAVAAFYAARASGFARPLALAGMAAGGLGLLSALLIGRTGRAVPVLAVLVSGAGYALALASAGQLAPAMQHVTSSLPSALPRIQVNTSAGHLDISLQPPGLSPSLAGGTTPQPRPSISPSPPPPTPAPTDPVAAARLEAARTAAARRLGLDYAAAQSQAATAAADLRTARDAYPPGSPELILASEKSMNANTALAAMQARLRADPDVAAAEQGVK